MLNKKVIIIATAALKYDEARVFSEKAAAASPSSSLLRFAHKTPKNRLSADFLPYKLRKQPDNRGFFAASSA
ncbi:MAG: hypothetical protein LBP76_05670, partial [Treponema sp.]|nr:hypothetical protein [Treponema sp.]